MRLFRKIYLQVLIGMMVLAFGMLVLLLWEVHRYSRSDICRYEEGEIRNNMNAIHEKIQREEMLSAAGTVKNALVVYEFRNAFGDRGVLWQSGKEVYNNSPYYFDKVALDKKCLAENKKEINTNKNTNENINENTKKHILYESPPQQAEGKRLLIFYQADAGFGEDEYSYVVYQDITDLYQRTRKLFCHGLGIAFCMTAIAGIVLYRGIYQSIQPLAALKQAAVRISGGDYSARVMEYGNRTGKEQDEIAQVTDSFNKMAHKVQEHMNILSETNENQQQLLGSLAHELKTPLTAIIGNADLLLTVSLKEAGRTKALNYILEEARRLSRLSEKMLELAGLSQRKGFIIKKETEVRGLLNQLKASAAFRLKEKKLHLEIKCVPYNLKKDMDKDLMLSLLMNLVDNACKASGEETAVIVSAEETGIYVQDFGSGIPQEELCRVTEAFYRIDPSRAGNGGAGLGLALCSRIAELHDGVLRIESIEGEGTTAAVLW